jgi:hypothetical protein
VSILIEFIPSLFVALAFDFMLYFTGAIILRIASFGLLKYRIHSYAEFKIRKKKTNKGFIIPYIIGVLFYVLLIALIAWLN